jgi:hypothetical protein
MKPSKQSGKKKSKTPLYRNTLVVNLLGGPGCGKSTMSAGLFSELKWRNIDCELAAEYAKDAVWEERYKTLENQIYVFGKQHHRIFRLLGKVQVIITDSPLFLTPIYDSERRESLKELAINEINKCNNLNIVLVRDKHYNPNGRNHTESEAREIDKNIEKFLSDNDFGFNYIQGRRDGVYDLTQLVIKILNESK